MAHPTLAFAGGSRAGRSADRGALSHVSGNVRVVGGVPIIRNPRIENTRALGSGTFSNVVAATTVTGERVAIKQFMPTINDNMSAVVRELTVGRLLDDNPHAVQASTHLPSFTRENRLCLGFKHHTATLQDFIYARHRGDCPAVVRHTVSAAGGTNPPLLADHSRAGRAPTPPAARALPLPLVTRFMTQLLTGLVHFERRGVVHADLKPANILVEVDTQTVRCPVLKICDFGGVTLALPRVVIGRQDIATAWYRAPECVFRKSDRLNAAELAHRLTGSVDAWAAGVILFEMLTGKTLAMSSTTTRVVVQNNEQIIRMFKRVLGISRHVDRHGRVSWTEETSRPRALPTGRCARLTALLPEKARSGPLCDVLCHLLHPDPTQRWSAATALAHLRPPARRKRSAPDTPRPPTSTSTSTSTSTRVLPTRASPKTPSTRPVRDVPDSYLAALLKRPRRSRV